MAGTFPLVELVIETLHGAFPSCGWLAIMHTGIVGPQGLRSVRSHTNTAVDLIVIRQ